MRPFETTDDAYVAGNQIRINARTSGQVLDILVDNTDLVEAGQLLVRLDPTDAALALEKAKSELAEAVRQIHSLKAQRQRLTALIEAKERELALAEAEYRRRLNLKTGASVTAEELERYRSQTLVSAANLRAAQYELEVTDRLLAKPDPAEHPQVLLAVAKLKEAWLALQRCQIRSPASGRVAKRSVQVGAQVNPQVALMAIIPQDEVWVEANFKESQLGRVRLGQPVTISSDMYGGRVEYQGLVAGLAAGTGSVFSLLPPENATGNWIKIVQRVPVRIFINNDDLKKAPLLLGLSLRTKIHVEAELLPLPPPPEGPVYSAYEEDYRAMELEKLINHLIETNQVISPPNQAQSPISEAQEP
jgi:membrane fusion protein (multidrug efflux system)